jgi:hypothetical protein
VGRFLVLVSVGVAALAAGGSALGQPGGARDDYAVFHTPSGNIGCGYTGAGGSPKGFLRCDIGTGIKPAPKKPASCQLDYGSGYSMGDTGRAKGVCAGDTVLHQGKVLAYGKTWRNGGFTCASKTTGLRCTNRSGHGFFLSKAHSYII